MMNEDTVHQVYDEMLWKIHIDHEIYNIGKGENPQAIIGLIHKGVER